MIVPFTIGDNATFFVEVRFEEPKPKHCAETGDAIDTCDRSAGVEARPMVVE
jgi:hypothetical protein